MAWLTIDAGTSVIKAVVYAEDGRELSMARQETTVLHPQPGWSEQDMHEVWAAAVSVIRRAAGASGQPILGVVTTAQGDGCWLVDSAGDPTGNAILWNDSRAARLIEQWRREGLIHSSFKTSGSVTYAGLANAILRWLHLHQPQRVDRSRWVLTCNGWLIAKMTGHFVTVPSESVNPFGDLAAGGYSISTITGYELESDAHRLPPIVVGRDAVWDLNETAAREFGLAPGLPVVMAPYDIVTTAYGSGAARAGQACVILGTTICAELVCSSIERDAEPVGTTLPLHDGLFLRAMPTLTGCEALQWVANLLGLAGISQLEELAAEVSKNRSHICFLPYLSPAGERSPFLAPEANGSFHGLTLDTRRGDIARAVYEGLSFVVRECVEAASQDTLLTEVRVCGGGARSDYWCQMISDVLGVPVVRPVDPENGARGAHLFALFAIGQIGEIADGVEMHVAVDRRFDPNSEARQTYDKRFNVFQQVRHTAMQQWNAMGEGR